MRFVSLNFWMAEPVLERRLALAERQLRSLAPDAIGMQEVVPIDGARTTAHVLADALDMHVVHEVAWQPNERGEGLAVLSKCPIGDHRALQLPESRPDEGRILLSARLDTPEGALWFHTTHLHWRLDDGVAREHQVVAVDEAARACASDLPHVLCGDFNATPAHDEIRFLRGEHTLAGRRTHWQDAWQRIHPDQPGYTWCAQNPQARAQRSLDVDRRIDYIFVSTREKDGRGTIDACEVELADRDEDGNCASDHFAVRADVRISPG